MLAVVTPTLQFGGIAGNFAASVSRTVQVSGTVVEDQNRMREWNDYGLRRLSKRLSLSGTAPDTAVIGTGVARVLQLCAPLGVPDCASATVATEATGPALPADIAALSDPGNTPAAEALDQAQPRIEILAANARGAPNVAAVNVLRTDFQGINSMTCTWACTCRRLRS